MSLSPRLVLMYRYIYLFGAFLEPAWGAYMQYFSPSAGSDNMYLRVLCGGLALLSGLLTFKRKFFVKYIRHITVSMAILFVAQRYTLLWANQEDYLYIIDLYTIFILCMVTYPSKKDMYILSPLFILPGVFLPAHDYTVVSNLITVAPLVGALKWQFFQILEENEKNRKKLKDVYIMQGATNLMNSMSHYVNNYLETINVSNQVLQFKKESQYHQQISSSVVGIKRLFDSFRDSFNDVDKESFVVENMVGEIFQKKGLSFEEKESTKIKFNKHVLKTALECLVSNAVDENKKKNKTKVKCEIQSTKDYVFIDIEDEACSLDPNDNETIFKPFYSTKKIHEGMGLSLSLSRELLQKNGGNLYVKSNYPTIMRIQININ